MREKADPSQGTNVRIKGHNHYETILSLTHYECSKMVVVKTVTITVIKLQLTFFSRPLCVALPCDFSRSVQSLTSQGTRSGKHQRVTSCILNSAVKKDTWACQITQWSARARLAIRVWTEPQEKQEQTFGWKMVINPSSQMFHCHLGKLSFQGSGCLPEFTCVCNSGQEQVLFNCVYSSKTQYYWQKNQWGDY